MFAGSSDEEESSDGQGILFGEKQSKPEETLEDVKDENENENEIDEGE